MKKRLLNVLALSLIAGGLYFTAVYNEKYEEPIIIEDLAIPYEKPTITLVDETTQTPEEEIIFVEEIQVLEEVDEPILPIEEIELIALVTMAEAEGECELGKRLVIDTILNRVDSKHFPNTVTDVIYQPNQFSSMWNGRVKRCYVSDDICKLVEEELESRQDSEVIYFTAGKYGKYGEPKLQVENHYFSK